MGDNTPKAVSLIEVKMLKLLLLAMVIGLIWEGDRLSKLLRSIPKAKKEFKKEVNKGKKPVIKVIGEPPHTHNGTSKEV